MKNIKEFVSSVISESALDSRIPNGIVDLKNFEHLQVIAEGIYEICEDESVVNEFVTTFMEEGKYPERQAYNKDGWLVTFPSKEYKDAAVRKKTHFSSDPTHGKGGMNLYYKKKGKQKRQTQQDISMVKPIEQPQASTKQPSKGNEKTSAAPKKAETPKTGEITPEMMGDEDSGTSVGKPETQGKIQAPVKTPTERPTTTTTGPKEPSDAAKSTDAPAIDVPVVTQAPKEYAAVSIKFAKQKGWVAEPYGEYRDGEGNPIAVVGLSGEVVPIRNNDREEYKIFAEKNMSKA